MSPYPYPRLTGWTVAGRLIGGGLALALALCLVGWTIVNLVPTSWLNAECWNDETPRPLTNTERHLQLARELGEAFEVRQIGGAS